jgi:hypothetical protein
VTGSAGRDDTRSQPRVDAPRLGASSGTTGESSVRSDVPRAAGGAPTRGAQPSGRRFTTDSDPHVIYCRGCGKTWLSPDCGCACTDGDPHYEDWVVDPWVCYCGVIAEFSEYLFPHADCDGGQPLAPPGTMSRC